MAGFNFTDVPVQGHFPCKGCWKIYTSNLKRKNKLSFHWSSHCNDKREDAMREEELFITTFITSVMMESALQNTF